MDDVFKGFCKGCVAKPEACPLAGNLTAEQLEEFLYTTLDDLKANPIPVVDPAMPGGGTLLDYSFVKAYFLRQLNFPSQWPSVAKMLAGAAAGGAEDTPSSEGQGADESQLGIKCSDVLKHTNNLTDLLPVYETRRKLSRFGGDTIDQVIAQCAQWKLPAKERYDGDFKIKTKNPVLIINNRHDPVTPIVSARNVSKTLEGSVLLEQNSYGVRTPPQPTMAMGC